jgi:adenosylhomocysteine nucleosidase
MNILLVVALEAELPTPPLNATVVYTGVGKVQAATRLAQALCKSTKPDLIVNYGTAGGLNPMIKGMHEIGTFVQRDMIAEPQAPRGTVPFSDPVLGNIKTAAPVMQVRCGTGDSFVMAPDPWFVTADIDCVDMEGWALAYVAQQFDIPFRSFKYISDMADENAAEEWANNVADGAGKFLDIYDKL